MWFCEIEVVQYEEVEADLSDDVNANCYRGMPWLSNYHQSIILH